MIVLKQVIHDTKTNSVEATWVDRTQLPDREVPEAFGPTTRAEGGTIFPGELIPAHVVTGEIVEVQVKCHSYADVQMDMLRTDLGEDAAQYADLIALVEAGIKPPEPAPEPSPAELIAAMQTAVQQRLDTFAQTRYYDSILSACTYATSTVPRFCSDGQYCVDARDSTWGICYQVLGEVEAGTRPMPTADELLALLPVLAWPGSV